MLVKLVCPQCRQELTQEETTAHCPACGKNYLSRDGILSFLEADRSFNPTSFVEKQEEAWSTSAQLRDRIRQSRFLTLVNWLRIQLSLSGRRDRVFYHEMRGEKGNRVILDVGCGGGRHYFCNYGKVIGIDPVFDLLRIARTIYDEVYQASAFDLPFPDNSFDYVVSTDVLGHIPTDLKDRLFSEIYRVLKKGGRTVHVAETDATNFWFRFAHRYPELFEKYFVQIPGHISLEMPSELRNRFLRHGFKQVRFRKYSGLIQQCGTLSGLFNNEYKAKSATVRLIVGMDRLLARNLAVQEFVNVLLEPIASFFDVLTPLDHGGGALVVFEKG